MELKLGSEVEVDELETVGGRSIELRVPASTSNLGAGFDCFGLALPLYLTVRVSVTSDTDMPCRIRVGRGEGYESLPRTKENLVYRAMSLTAERLDQKLPPVRIMMQSEIPVGGGLGSSAAAIVAGVAAGQYVCGLEISDELILRYATEMEGHADNVAPSLYGGWVVTCTKPDGSVWALKKRWPTELKILVISPSVPLDTAHARALLPLMVSRADAIHNLQRTALFTAAIEERAFELLWEAMQDRLHQDLRAPLLPGLREALETPRLPGLVGLALSGAGPSILALVQDNYDEIGKAIAAPFQRHGLHTTRRLLEVENEGTVRRQKAKGRRRTTFNKKRCY